MLNIIIIILAVGFTFTYKLEEGAVCEGQFDQCNYGLKCAKVCIEDPNAADCFKKHLDIRRRIKKHILGMPLPKCEDNGEYKSVQCLGSICYCADKAGVHISGFNTAIENSVKKNCKCARQKHLIDNHQLNYTTINCDSFGNFNPHQCKGSLCFCVDANGTTITSSPTAQMSEIAKLKCPKLLK